MEEFLTLCSSLVSFELAFISPVPKTRPHKFRIERDIMNYLLQLHTLYMAKKKKKSENLIKHLEGRKAGFDTVISV